MRFEKAFLLGCLLIGLSSCGGEKEVDRLGDAQRCLDRIDGPDSAAIQQCLAPISDLSGSGADSLRCTAGFMTEDLASGRRIIQGFDRLGENPSSDKTLALMEILSFTSQGAAANDFQSAESTFNACLASGAKGATLLASFSYLSMSLINYFSSVVSCAMTPVSSGTYDFPYYDLSDCADVNSFVLPGDLPKVMAIAELANAGTVSGEAINTQSGIGAVMIAAAQISCPVGETANKTLCEMMTNAISAAGGPSNPRAVAIEFFSQALAFPP
ncbi:MAG TPA: hypothetical protein PL182_05240 [Pseudobdellovibrionaceae bacterium]|nr:hypothetical protein [Pseudobdellovibrionaceae bacterium]